MKKVRSESVLNQVRVRKRFKEAQLITEEDADDDEDKTDNGTLQGAVSQLNFAAGVAAAHNQMKRNIAGRNTPGVSDAGGNALSTGANG